MGKSILIADTTREERIRIVVEALATCNNNPCTHCVGCTLDRSAEKMYMPYIDGEMEISEVNRAHANKKFIHY